VSAVAMKMELLLREPFLADVRRLGYKRAIKRLKAAVAIVRAVAPTAVALVDRGTAQ